MNPKIKTYVLMVSTKFPAYHFQNGDPTLFIEKIASGEKIHTIRCNYELWKKRFEKIEKGEAVLSVRSWEGKPYQSKQIEHFVFTKDDGIGIQKISFKQNCVTEMLIDGEKTTSSELVAYYDGLKIVPFLHWFAFYNIKEPTPMAIIHFTNFRY